MASQREQIFENKNFSSEVLGYKNTLNRNERKSQDPNDCFTISQFFQFFKSQAETSNSDQFHEFIDLRIESAYQGNKVQVNQQGKEMNSDHLILKKYVLNNQIEKIPSAREKMKPKTIQNNLLEYALKVKHTLEINVNKLIEEVNNLEDQTFDPLSIYIQFEYHPNYLAIQCLEQIEQLNLFIDENLKLINQVNGNEEIIQFYCCEEVKILQQFQDFQDQRFELKEQYILDYGSDENYAHEEISAFQQSPNKNLLACCQYKTITIWNLIQNLKINEITHQRFIQSITFYDDSNNFIIGDDKGVITKFTSYCKQSQPSLSYQVHQASIIQMIIKLKDQIYSCSIDNSIRLSDLSQNKILLIINNCFGCQSGFEYSQKEKVIIAPNNKQQLILWDEISGKELANSNLQIQETEFISICLSDAQDKILVNLFKECKIILLEIQNKSSLKELNIIKQLNMEGKCYSLSWCMNDQAFQYLLYKFLMIRFIGQKSFPLIMESPIRQNFQRTYKPLTNKQNQKLKEIIITLGRIAYMYNLVPRPKFDN